MRFEMTKEQHEKLLDAGKPTRVMYISGGIPIGGTPQSNANHAWEDLGRELGFKPYTVKPIPGEPETVFEAEQANAL